MKKIIVLYGIICLTFNVVICQEIPFGKSVENFTMKFDSTHFENWTIGYYKPLNYDPATSEMIIYFHGQGGTEDEGYSLLKAIADKRGCLIVSPTDGAPWVIAIINYYDFITFTNYYAYLPTLIKQLYKYILIRENRIEIPVRMLGFSAGAQCVTRYMLLRQGITDSIPLKMAISLDPYTYAFPTDSLQGISMIYPFGIGKNSLYDMASCSNTHIKNYYNENYTVMIGTADSIYLGDTRPSTVVQGDDRYERAQNFYNFSQQNAIEKGTTLKWNYAEVPNIGHDGYGLVYTKALLSDTVSICEHYLFDMPYHEPEKFSPTADFTYSVNDTTKCYEFSAKCKCWWQTVPTSYLWDFGNGTTANGVNAQLNYTDNGLYNVQLIVENQYGSDTIVKQIEVENIPDIDFVIIDSVTTLPNANVTFLLQVFFPNDSVLWNFGDGTTTNIINPTHSYTQKGIYPITLLKFRDQYCADTVKKTVRIIDNTALAENFDNSKITILQQKDVLTIKSLQEPISIIKLLNIQGEVVCNQTISENVFEYFISTSKLHGIYICIVETGNDVFVKKINVK